MKHTEAIAAILAANTPLKAARYAVDNPPAAEIARLLDEVVDLYDAIGSALSCLRGDSLDMAIVVLEKAMKGTTMNAAPEPPPPPEPGDNPDKDSTPQTEGPSPL